MRKSLEETWRHLESEGEEAPRRPDGRPFVPEAMPCIDDEVLGFSFFRCAVEEVDYSDLTLPHTFFGRSGFIGVRFVNADLSGSRICWNDFEACDFSRADLSGSSFERCDFTGAELSSALAADGDAEGDLRALLTGEQQALVVWSPDPGPEPPGG